MSATAATYYFTPARKSGMGELAARNIWRGQDPLQRITEDAGVILAWRGCPPAPQQADTIVTFPDSRLERRQGSLHIHRDGDGQLKVHLESGRCPGRQGDGLEAIKLRVGNGDSDISYANSAVQYLPSPECPANMAARDPREMWLWALAVAMDGAVEYITMQGIQQAEV